MTNLLDLPLDQFRGYLAEGNYPQARQDELMRAYRAKNSLSGLLDRYGEEGLEGKNVSTFFPVAGPGGMSIFDALKSGQLQTRFKDYASDALGGVIGALENPKASYDGTLPQADYDGAAMGTGGLAMGGGGVVAAPAGSLRSFAGRNAKTADLDALKAAKELSARKRDPEDIFRQTGWFKGKDGQWRFEIDDSQAEFIGNSRRNALLGDVIKHDELFAAYPELRNVLTATDVRGSQEGSYQPFIDNSGERQRLGVMGEGIRDIEEEIRAFGPTKPAILNTLLHEAGGHALQRREGFAPGSSRGTATDQLLLERNTFLKNLSNKMDARQAELGLSGYRPATNDLMLKRLREQYDANVGRALSEDDIYERYYTEAGEVDGRNIQLRQDMTPAERRALSPMATEDVPRSEQRLSGDVVNANASKSAGLLAAALKEDLDPLGYQKPKMRGYLSDTDVQLSDAGENLPRQPMSWEDVEGKVVLPFYGDRTSRGLLVEGVNDLKFEQPVYTEGGVDFMVGPAAQKDRAIWASNQNIIKWIEAEAEKAAKQFGERDVLGLTGSMSPDANDFATFTGASMAELVKGAKITKKSAKEFDKVMRAIDPDFVGVLSPKLREWATTTSSPKRKSFIRLMESSPMQQAGFPSPAEARYSVTDPTQRDLPAGMFGLGTAKIDGSAPLMFNEPKGNLPSASVPHSTYNTQIAGDYLGSLPPVPQGLLFKDVYDAMEGKTTKSGQALNEGHKTHAIKTKMPAQIVTPQVLDGILQYLSRLEK